MFRLRRLFVAAAAVVLCFCFAGLVAAKTFPSPQGFVNDFAGLFSSQFRQQLEARLADFEKSSSIEIAVVTLPSLEGEPIEEVAVRLFEEWGIGKKDQDNGLLLLIAPQERRIRIEVGYGLEPLVTDAAAGRIIREKMAPAFKEGDYEKGTLLAVEELIRLTTNQPTPAPPASSQSDFSSLLVFFLGLLTVYSAAFLSRSKSFYAGAVVGFFFGLGLVLLAHLVFLSAVVTVFLFSLIGLFLDWLFSRNYKALKKAGRSTSWWSSRGGFSSGGGGFGGFGGGHSGGGGASGGW